MWKMQQLRKKHASTEDKDSAMSREDSDTEEEDAATEEETNIDRRQICSNVGG